MADDSLLYHCWECRWRGSALTPEWTCPRCGSDDYGASQMSSVEAEPGARPELVFSARQLSPDYPWPKGYWRGVGARVLAGEVDVNSRVLARVAVRYAPPEPAGPGAPRGPRGIDSRSEFEALLTQIVPFLDKHHAEVPKVLIAKTLHYLTKQSRDKRQDLLRASQAALEVHSDGAAKIYLRRCEIHFGVDADEVIARIRENPNC